MSTNNNQVPIPATLVAANATVAERARFKFLWQKHLNMRQQYKIVYYLPQSMGEKMGRAQLVGMAENLRTHLYTNVYVHFDSGDQSFRVGQVTDKADCDYVNQIVLLHTAVYTPPAAPSSTFSSNGSISGNVVPSTLNAVIATNSSGVINTRASRRSNSPAKIPKPRNSWVIYRQDKHEAVSAAHPGMHNSLLSKVISAMWRNESIEVRHFYIKRGLEERADHKRLFPGYKCQPRKASEIKKRNVRSKEVVIYQPQEVEAYNAGGVDSYPSDAVNRLFNGLDTVFSAHQSADVAGDATADLFNGLDKVFAEHQAMDVAGAATADLFNDLDAVFSAHQSADVAGDATADLFNGLDNVLPAHQSADVAGGTTDDLFDGLDNILSTHQSADLAGDANDDLFDGLDDIVAEYQATDAAETITPDSFDSFDFFDSADLAEFEEILDFPGDLDLDLPSLELQEFSESLLN